MVTLAISRWHEPANFTIANCSANKFIANIFSNKPTPAAVTNCFTEIYYKVHLCHATKNNKNHYPCTKMTISFYFILFCFVLIICQNNNILFVCCNTNYISFLCVLFSWQSIRWSWAQTWFETITIFWNLNLKPLLDLMITWVLLFWNLVSLRRILSPWIQNDCPTDDLLFNVGNDHLRSFFEAT